MYIPIVSSCVPPATPGPHKNTGYAFVRAPASQPLALPFPKRQDGSPVLNLDEVHFSVYYPTSEHRAARAPTVQWMPKPVGAVLDGYAAYFGGWGPKILCTLDRHQHRRRLRRTVAPSSVAMSCRPARSRVLTIVSQSLV